MKIKVGLMLLLASFALVEKAQAAQSCIAQIEEACGSCIPLEDYTYHGVYGVFALCYSRTCTVNGQTVTFGYTDGIFSDNCGVISNPTPTNYAWCNGSQ